jgi:predicted aspartyl protease
MTLNLEVDREMDVPFPREVMAIAAIRRLVKSVVTDPLLSLNVDIEPEQHEELVALGKSKHFKPLRRSTGPMAEGSMYSHDDNIPYLDDRSSRQAKTILKEPYVPAILGGKDVSAFLDSGATANFLSLDFVRQQDLIVKLSSGSSTFSTASGSKIRILGTVKLPFSFKGDTAIHNVLFNVVSKCVHDMVLGSRFLASTMVMTSRWLMLKTRQTFGYRVCLAACGNQQYVTGQLNDIHVDAVPDTGADVSVMSAAFAKEHGFIVNTNRQHRPLLQFADGSTAVADGLVDDVDWRYGTDGVAHATNIYVLSGLPVDMVLGYGFFMRTDAFNFYKDDFWNDENSEQEGFDAIFSIIKVMNKILKNRTGSQSISRM